MDDRDQQRKIKHRVAVLRHVEEISGNVAATCRYYGISRALPWVLQYAVAAGVIYGVIVYFFMNRVVVPLSAARKFPFSLKMMILGVTIHIFCVGLPIAIMARRFSARTP